jgi:hypothetical protein
MADITDVETAMVNIVAAAIYPNGTSQASILPPNISNVPASASIARGWPLPACLDADLPAGNAQITVFPLGGSASQTYQLLDQTYTIQAATVATTATLSGNTVTVSGQPATGEFLTLIIDDMVIVSQGGTTTAAMLAALATEAQGKGYPGSSATATTLTIPAGHSLVMRQGGVGIQGKVIHRQKHSIMVTVWAPSDAVRTAAAIAADIALKEHIKITMPDTSQCILRYQRTMSSDQQEKAMIYRRDLIYEAEFATVEQFPGTTITSVQVSLQNLADNNSVNAVAII